MYYISKCFEWKKEKEIIQTCQKVFHLSESEIRFKKENNVKAVKV